MRVFKPPRTRLLRAGRKFLASCQNTLNRHNSKRKPETHISRLHKQIIRAIRTLRIHRLSPNLRHNILTLQKVDIVLIRKDLCRVRALPQIIHIVIPHCRVKHLRVLQSHNVSNHHFVSGRGSAYAVVVCVHANVIRPCFITLFELILAPSPIDERSGDLLYRRFGLQGPVPRRVRGKINDRFELDQWVEPSALKRLISLDRGGDFDGTLLIDHQRADRYFFSGGFPMLDQ